VSQRRKDGTCEFVTRRRPSSAPAVHRNTPGIRRVGSKTSARRLRRAAAAVAVAIAALALGGCARKSVSHTESAAATVPRGTGWGDTGVPYRSGSGRACKLAAEGTSIRPDVVNRLVFLNARDARQLVTGLRARDRELVTAAPVELQGDLDAIARAAARLHDGLEANGFKLQGVPDEVLGSLSSPDLRPAFERATAYLNDQCDIDVWAILSTV
jgi:hypothetical protein